TTGTRRRLARSASWFALLCLLSEWPLPAASRSSNARASVEVLAHPSCASGIASEDRVSSEISYTSVRKVPARCQSERTPDVVQGAGLAMEVVNGPGIARGRPHEAPCAARAPRAARVRDVGSVRTATGPHRGYAGVEGRSGARRVPDRDF